MTEFDRSLPMMLARTLEAVLPRFRSIFTQFGLTETQWRILRILWERDRRAVIEISRSTLIPNPSLIGVLDRLVRAGLVERSRSDQDRRQVFVCLTQQGRALQAQVEPLVDQAYEEIQALLPAKQWKSFYSAIDQLCAKAETMAHAQSKLTDAA